MSSGTNPYANDQSLYGEFLFRIKATLFQVNRGIRNFANPLKLYPKNDSLFEQEAIATSVTPLWDYSLSNRENEEQKLQLGKIQNLRIAAQAIHGIEIPQDSIFSFWTHVGQTTKIKGYVKGREIRQGCMIPSVGGGLCQLSNALYSVALDLGFEILERHAHTKIIPGSLAEIGRDATVFWNYVDLRFRVNQSVRFEVYLTEDSLVVQVKCVSQNNSPSFTSKIDTYSSMDGSDRTFIDQSHDCLSCNISSCHKQLPQKGRDRFQRQGAFGKTAYLVDEYWIEFDQYIQSQKTDQDILLVPIDGKKFNKRNYEWSQDSFSRVETATLLTLTRALATRHLSSQGQSLQSSLLKYDQKLADYFGSLLTYDISHIVVMQNLLPFLWQNGSLQGRTFDVLMTRSPITVLQEKLDFAYTFHPDSPTLNDFRVDSKLMYIEMQALSRARHLITPHSAIAALFPERSHLIDWHIPEAKSNLVSGNRILFPASAIGRKGAYEIREVAKNLNLELTVLGRNLEGESFWQGLTIYKPDPNYLNEINMVILPAFVEHKPRILLNAVAHNIPVIASSECGLGSLNGVIEVPSGDVNSLMNAVAKLRSPRINM